MYLGKPLSSVTQLAPLLVVSDTPALPAKIEEPLTANALTELVIKPTSVQLAPLLADRNKPFWVPTKILEPLMANEVTTTLTRPFFSCVQVPPLSVVK